ncbi:MAG: 3-phosphoserine/phosphohydroxythreonine transaminase [Magnetococcales bacterium]|nr:3-phosphoserine/phosphohydroxythreonine transaminase [Magnetococcales bacterium]
MARVFNFSAGPSVLPLSVLQKAAGELIEYGSAGMSVMEMSHRSKEYMTIITQAEALLRELMQVPDNYKVLFQQGGATLQFATIPMNLLTTFNRNADYIHTGIWSKKAIAECNRQGHARIAASSEAENFTRIPRQDELDLDPAAAYVHMTTNNTIFGTEFPYIPDVGDVPLVADMSSNIMSREMDVSKFGLIYAGAQKNLGPAGVTLVIIREDLLGRHAGLPLMLDYKVQAEKESMLNTPPTYGIYMLGLVLQWIKENGGIASIEKKNIHKAAKLYQAIDNNDFYCCPTEVESRSRMNVPFTLKNPDLDATFLAEAEQQGLMNLKGHRLSGGMRASIYNAMSEEGIDALIAFMEDFANRNG